MGQVDNESTTCIHEKLNLDEKNDGWSFDGLNDDRNDVEGREVVNKRRSHLQGHFHLKAQNGRR